MEVEDEEIEEMVEEDVDEKEILEPREHSSNNGHTKEKQEKLKSKLELLLSQNDILPILKYLNSNKNGDDSRSKIENYINNLNVKYSF